MLTRNSWRFLIPALTTFSENRPFTNMYIIKLCVFCILYFLLFLQQHLTVLTDRLFMDLLSKVGPFGETVQVSLQDVPAYLVVKWEAEFGMNLSRGKIHIYINSDLQCTAKILYKFNFMDVIFFQEGDQICQELHFVFIHVRERRINNIV